ncbi:MAG TPA: hypothetical protein VL383_01555, partial [Gemmatimonadaceae bacterium]|nr:hypothetical protein [Gemmatimonadaceae bacterium]
TDRQDEGDTGQCDALQAILLKSINLMPAVGGVGLLSRHALGALRAHGARSRQVRRIDSRFAEGLGVVAKLIATNIKEHNLEGGLQVTQQRDLEGVNGNFGLKLSYVVRFDNLPALNAAGIPLEKTDRILSSGIQLSF